MYTTTFVWTVNWQVVFRIWLKNYKNDVIPVQIYMYIYFAIVLTHELTRSYLKNKVIYYLRNRKHVPCFYRVIETWVEGWKKQEMLWEHEPQVSVSTTFSSSPKLSRVFLNLDRNMAYIVSISFWKHRDNFDYQNVNSLCSRHHYINSAC